MGGGALSLDLLKSMKKRLDAQQTVLAKLDAYYCGDQPLSFLHPDLRERLQRRITPLVINWPRVIVSGIAERLRVQGFGSGGVNDERLWSWWQANDLDEWSQMGHTDALVHGRAFLSVWSDEERPDVPRIAVESARQLVVSYVPGTRRLAAALKSWRDGDSQDADQYAVLYLPDVIEKYASEGRTGVWVRDGDDVPNPLGQVPIVPLVNRPRLTDLSGESELADVIPVADAVNKLATDMMVSSEFHAMPRRWVTGMETPREGAARAQMAEEIRRAWSEAFPGKPWIGGKDVGFGQFEEASLENFINAIKLLTSQIAAIAHLPPHYLGINTDNPASAEAVRNADASAARTAEDKQTAFGGSYERAMRIAVDVMDGVGAGQKLDDLEVDWVDAWIPTPAQAADAAVKLTQGDRPIITVDQARRDLGYSPQQIDDMNAETDRAAAMSATADVRARVEMAQQLMDTQGLSQPAAYAAVGLLQAASQMGPSGGQPAPGAA
jgi:hypothetical protein